jgi:hypothetical protein
VLDGDDAVRCPGGSDERGRNRLFRDRLRLALADQPPDLAAISATVRMWVSEFSGTAMLK